MKVNHVKARYGAMYLDVNYTFNGQPAEYHGSSARLCPIHAAWANASSMRFQIWLGISMRSRRGRDMK